MESFTERVLSEQIFKGIESKTYRYFGEEHSRWRKHLIERFYFFKYFVLLFI